MKVAAQHKIRLWWLLVFFGGAVSLVLIPLAIRAGSGWLQYSNAVVPGVLALTLMRELRRRRLPPIGAAPFPVEVLNLAANGDRMGAIRRLLKVRYASLAQAKSAVDHLMTEQRAAVTEDL